MPAGSREVGTDDQQFGACELSRFQLIAQLVDKMLRRIQILDRCDAVGQHSLAEYLRDLLPKETVALFLVMAAESTLYMNMRVNQSGHKGKTGPVDHGRGDVLDRFAADRPDRAVFYEDVLVKQLAAVAYDDMDVPDQIPVRLLFPGTAQKFDQGK